MKAIYKITPSLLASVCSEAFIKYISGVKKKGILFCHSDIIANFAYVLTTQNYL